MGEIKINKKENVDLETESVAKKIISEKQKLEKKILDEKIIKPFEDIKIENTINNISKINIISNVEKKPEEKKNLVKKTDEKKTEEKKPEEKKTEEKKPEEKKTINKTVNKEADNQPEEGSMMAELLKQFGKKQD